MGNEHYLFPNTLPSLGLDAEKAYATPALSTGYGDLP